MLYRNIILNDENDPIYQIGDRYPDAEHAIGIVFETSNGGRNGKIVSLDEPDNKLPWSLKETANTGATNAFNGMVNMHTITQRSNWKTNYSVFEWVHGKNDSNTDYSDPDAKGIWYLPAIDELEALYLVYNEDREGFNTLLTNAQGVILSSSWYWSSSESLNVFALSVNFDNGFRTTQFKIYYQTRVRCVSAF